MKKFWNWVIALVLAPIVIAISLLVFYGAIAFASWVSSLSIYIPEIAGSIIVIVLLAIVIEEAGIPGTIIDWITSKRRN